VKLGDTRSISARLINPLLQDRCGRGGKKLKMAIGAVRIFSNLLPIV
jgi:hypothetical protein